MTNRFLITIMVGIGLLGSSISLSAQGDLSVLAGEKQLLSLLNKIKTSPYGDERGALQEQFTEQFTELLRHPSSFKYPFDSLGIVFKIDLTGADSRLYSWDFPAEGGFHEFHGILVTRSGKNMQNLVTTLNDVSDSLVNDSMAAFVAPSWYGAVYYQAVPFRLSGNEQVHFLLLGWKGINNLLASRVIEVLSREKNGTFRFGKPVFCMADHRQASRIIFRYSAASSMVLKYEVQALPTDKQWNAKKKKFTYTYKKCALVVTDRLVPQDPQLKGQYEYYVASSDVVDGFILEKSCWRQVFDIDARNPSENQQKTVKAPGK